YVIPCTKYTISKTCLRTSQAILGALTVLSIGIEIEGASYHQCPEWVYQTGYGLIAFSVTSFLGTCTLKRISSSEIVKKIMNSSTKLLDPEEIKTCNLNPLIHELCEMDIDGSFFPCSQSRLQEIIAQLKKQNLLKALNTIPEHSLVSNDQLRIFPVLSTL